MQKRTNNNTSWVRGIGGLLIEPSSPTRKKGKGGQRGREAKYYCGEGGEYAVSGAVGEAGSVLACGLGNMVVGSKAPS